MIGPAPTSSATGGVITAAIGKTDGMTNVEAKIRDRMAAGLQVKMHPQQAVADSFGAGFLRVTNHDYVDGTLVTFQPQSELCLERGEQCRRNRR